MKLWEGKVDVSYRNSSSGLGRHASQTEPGSKHILSKHNASRPLALQNQHCKALASGQSRWIVRHLLVEFVNLSYANPNFR